MKRLALLSMTIVLACSATRRDFATDVDRIIAAHPEQTIAVAFHDLETGETFLRNEREVFHAASTMKVPVMLGIFEAVSAGELRLDQPVRVHNEFKSILDASKYAY
jgi:beta-lactamase class A